MSNVVTLSSRRAFNPFRLTDWHFIYQAVAVVFGTVFLTVSSYIEVPMIPVPITMQTLAVPLLGAVYGWRLGGLTIVAWLLQGAMGLPVLAGGTAGLQRFVGPTGGYLLAFPIAGALVGWLAERGWNGNRPELALVGMLLSNVVCLLFGASWLAAIIGVHQAIVHGVMPFLVGTILKATLGAAILKLLVQRRMWAAE